MALRTFQARVAALQWVRRRSVLLHGEQRRFPSLHIVAGSAFAAIRPLGELTVVSILVAIHALLKRDGFLEVAVCVALSAIDGGMFAQQGELGLGMVKALVQRLQVNLLPSARVVAGLAALRETAMMRVLMAIGTLVERDAYILRLAIGAVDVALGALHLGVQSSEWIPSLGVIELAHVDRLPVHEVVAGLAVRTEAPFVLVLVAGKATRR